MHRRYTADSHLSEYRGREFQGGGVVVATVAGVAGSNSMELGYLTLGLMELNGAHKSWDFTFFLGKQSTNISSSDQLAQHQLILGC